jgi:hypothetical protein
VLCHRDGEAVDQQEQSMRAWTVDADDIRVADDFDEALLHRTPEIDSFLAPNGDDKFIVIGTKGFGKTLLLKAKRIPYQREGARSASQAAACSTSRSATKSSAERRWPSSPRRRRHGRRSG